MAVMVAQDSIAGAQTGFAVDSTWRCRSVYGNEMNMSCMPEKSFNPASGNMPVVRRRGILCSLFLKSI